MPGKVRVIFDRIPKYYWLSLYRHFLRECAYLPDPTARHHLREHVQDRFRTYAAERRFWMRYDYVRHHNVWASGVDKLKTLRRANEGCSKQLEKVLRMAYGRKGRRRRRMLDLLERSDVPADTAAVKELVKKPTTFDDDWAPPAILMNLLRSQHNNGAITQLGHRQMKYLEPQIPKKCVWGDGVKLSRRKNIRQEWWVSVVNILLPPLPDADLKMLEGLITGTVPWELPLRRKPAGPITTPEDQLREGWIARSHDVPVDHDASLDDDAPLDREYFIDNSAPLGHKYLIDGPKKGHTFRPYANGRPHHITRRFMRRLWQRVSCLVPRMEVDATTKKPTFVWDTIKPIPSLYASVKKHKHKVFFGGVDDRGKRRKQETNKPKPKAKNGRPPKDKMSRHYA